MWRSRFLIPVVIYACAAIARAEAPNVVLITIDTTRADRMGFLGASFSAGNSAEEWLSHSGVYRIHDS